MFSGIGGFEVGIEKAFAESNVEQYEKEYQAEDTRSGFRMELGRNGKLSGDCIGYSEIDRYATAIYRRHFPEHRNFGDATTLNVSELPDFDLLVGGFPCQAFSIAGKREGFLDARGTLFFEIARVLEYKRPRYFLLENVEGLLSHDDRKTFVRIIGVLADIGYRVQWQVLNTKDYGLPQNRERIFIAGCIGNGSRFEVFPIAENSRNVTESQEESAGSKSGFRYINTLRSAGGGNDGMSCLLEIANAVTPDAYLARGERERIDGKPSKDPTPMHKRQIRRLTPTECERLQGFEDGWTEHGIDESGKEIKISDTQRYRCLGNAVSTVVIERIIRKWFYEN